MAKADTLLQACREKHILLAVAESCTGGLLAATLTEIPHSSDVFDRGFVTYSNASKMELLGVPAAIIQEHGAVSEATAMAMAEGVLQHSRAWLAAAITGIAGPGGGSAKKPVGLIYLATAVKGGEVRCDRMIFKGNRHEVRVAAVDIALYTLFKITSNHQI